MIQYFPFTYMPEELAVALTRALGPLAVWQPLETLIPAHLSALAGQGRFHWLMPRSLDAARLTQAVRSFSEWGKLHQGKVGDLSTLFKAAQSDAASEGNAQQIRSQIRHREDKESPEADTALFQAALFLSLAHSYDQQQDALDHELRTVRQLETRFGQILGDDSRDASLRPVIGAASSMGIDPGTFMTSRRLQSWARLAATRIARDEIYVTTSRAIWEQVMALFPDAICPFNPAAQDKPAARQTPGEGVALLSKLVHAKDPRRLIVEGLGSLKGEGLTVAVLADYSPEAFFDRIQQEGGEPELPPAEGNGFGHTVLGYLSL